MSEESDFLEMREEFEPTINKAVAFVYKSTYGIIDHEDLRAQADLVLWEGRSSFWEAWREDEYERLVFTSLKRALNKYVQAETQARYPDFEAYTPHEVERLLEAHYNGASIKSWGASGGSGLANETGGHLATTADIHRALKALSTEMRQTIDATYGNPTMSMAEIAAELDIPEDTLRKRKLRAVKRLCRALSHPLGIKAAMGMEQAAVKRQEEVEDV